MSIPPINDSTDKQEDWHLCADPVNSDNNSQTPIELQNHLVEMLNGNITNDEYVEKINRFFEAKIN